MPFAYQLKAIGNLDLNVLRWLSIQSHSAGVRKDRHHGSWLAHVSPYSGNDVSRDGRTPTYDPRLFASQQPSRDQPVSASNIAEQTDRTGEVGGSDLAWRNSFGIQNNNGPMSGLNGIAQFRDAARADWTQTDPDSVSGIFASA